MKKSILKGATVPAMLSLSFVLYGCGGNKVAETPPATQPAQPPAVKEKHIYDNAKVVDMKNGSGTAVIGKVSVLKISSSDLTQETLEDWYFNYAKKNVKGGAKWNYALIVYTDKPGRGVIYNSVLTKDVKLTPSKNDETYSAGGDGITLVEDKDKPGHLKKI